MAAKIFSAVTHQNNTSRRISLQGGSAMQSYGTSMSTMDKIVLSSVIGGTAEALGGGKFANGAVTGAYVMMLNHLMHEWHKTRTGAAQSAATKTTTTGNETSVIVYQDDSGNNRYWESPHSDKNTTTSSYWVFPPAEDTYGLTLVEEFHYSVMDGPIKEGKPTWIKGSFQDWVTARSLNIPVTHYTIGIGSWRFEPTLFFVQPQTVIHRGYIHWNNASPIKPATWYVPFKP